MTSLTSVTRSRQFWSYQTTWYQSSISVRYPSVIRSSKKWLRSSCRRGKLKKKTIGVDLIVETSSRVGIFLIMVGVMHFHNGSSFAKH
ncbi:hypothetical protein MKW98_023104 [Papaver atlanticum]|uniref:Uncharacterized protein n=1 Tax=Papaver atlanticum TaxID=357466 RepID=A0AAD4TAI2_9MAGN|nr:hypothetical protein MKW98_023104 [Papaver atlanticum]